MQFDVIERYGDVRLFVIANICPFCGKRTARKLGDAVVMRLASQAANEGELICYHCKNPDCDRMNYYVRKADFRECIP